MFFYLSILTRHGQFREFDYPFDKLEVGLNFINFVVAHGDTLLTIHLVEDGKRSELSPELFDGTPSRAPMQELEQEWQTLLSQPVRPVPVIDHELAAINQQRMRQCETTIEHNGLMISKLQALVLRNDAGIRDEHTRYRLKCHYESQITIFEEKTAKLQVCKENIARRLCELVPA